MNKDVPLQSLDKDCRVPPEKDFINVDKLFLRVKQSWRQRRSQYWKNVECQSEDNSDAPRSERNLLPLPILSVAETLGWCQSEGNVDLPTSYAKFTIEGVNHLYGSPAKRLRKNSSLGQREAQHKNLWKSRECMSD